MTPDLKKDIASQEKSVIRLDAERNKREWMGRLQLNQKGAPLSNEANLITTLEYAPDLKEMVRLDTFKDQYLLSKRPPWEQGPFGERVWADADDVELLNWFQKNGIQVRGTTAVTNAIRAVARRHSIDTLKDFLEGLQWDGTNRITHWLHTYLDADDNQLNEAVSRKFLISAVARGLDPGCKADHVLVLEGIQGVGKSELVVALGGEWTQENLPDMHSKDGMAALSGAWIIELSELSAMNRSQVESVKSFISRRVDKYRPAYGRHTIEQPRRCVFIATTNESRYLRDKTGNRRFWPVEVGNVDLEGLRRDREQLFAEAVAAYRDGERWYLTDRHILREMVNRQHSRVEHHPWQPRIAEFLGTEDRVTTKAVMERLGIEASREHAGHAKVISGILRDFGWMDRRDQSGGADNVVWTPGPDAFVFDEMEEKF
jgi:predicted P-loop ATPase